MLDHNTDFILIDAQDCESSFEDYEGHEQDLDETIDEEYVLITPPPVTAGFQVARTSTELSKSRKTANNICAEFAMNESLLISTSKVLTELQPALGT
jgi:hypothetical protein